MPTSTRRSLAPVAAVLLAAVAACSGGTDRPTVSADLEQDLARAGGANVELAGSGAKGVDVVSAAERVESPAPARTPTVARTATATRARKAPARSPRRAQPAADRPAPSSPAPAPVSEPRPQPRTEPAPQTRPEAPIPAPQREPPGGWRTPGEVIRNAPFPINP
jgi:hypothetical protein